MWEEENVAPLLSPPVFHKRARTHTFISHISFKRTGIGFKSFLPTFSKNQKTLQHLEKGTLQLFLIICGRPNQGQPRWSHLHGFQVLPFTSVPYQFRFRGSRPPGRSFLFFFFFDWLYLLPFYLLSTSFFFYKHIEEMHLMTPNVYSTYKKNFKNGESRCEYLHV